MEVEEKTEPIDNKNVDNKKKSFVILGAIFALLLVAIFVAFYFKSLDSKENDNAINIQKYVTRVTDNDLATYNIDLYGAVKDLGKIDDLLNLGKYNIVLNYKIKNYDVKLKLVNGPYEDVIGFDLYVNEKLIRKADGYANKWNPYLMMYILGDNIIYENPFHTDIISGFTIINNENGNVKKIYVGELEQTKGMIFKKINVSAEGILVNGTRIYHDVINYDKRYNIYYGSNYSKDLDDKYENGKINMNPIVSNQVSLNSFLKKMQIHIQQYIKQENVDAEYKKYSIDLEKAYSDNNLTNEIILSKGVSTIMLFKLDDYNISFKLNNYHTQYLNAKASDYSLFVNDNFIYDDVAFLSSDIIVEKLGKYLFFKDNNCTDMRCEHLYVVDESGLLKTIYELDKIDGLVMNNYEINKNGIVVNASRISHGSLIYGNDHYDIQKKEECGKAISKLSKDMLVSATYTYKYENGILSLEPEVSNKVTLDEYLSKNSNLCIQ